jgi:glycosyltransferase involved in cell wall biosynthesis
MTEPLVSVLSITYNHGPYVAEAIESFLGQKTNFPFEIVIGEDCSTDGTREIVFDYARRYPDLIRVITSDCNVGASGNFLRTFEACRGKYIAICEGDDFWQHPGKLQMQTDFLEKNPEYGLVQTDYDEIDQPTHEVTRSCFKSRGLTHEADYFNVEDMLLGKNPSIITATVLMRRSIMAATIEEDADSFDGRYPMGDLQLWVGAAACSKIKVMPESTATYRRLPVSMTQSPTFKNQLRLVEGKYDVIMHLCLHYSCRDGIRPLLHRKIGGRLMQIAFLASDIDAARRAMKRFKDQGLPVSLEMRLCFYALKWRVPGYALHIVVSVRRLARRGKKILQARLGQ